MGVKLNVTPKKPETLSVKPTFENTEDNTPVTPAIPHNYSGPHIASEGKDVPACFVMDTPTPATEGWQGMDTAPRDRPILVIGYNKALPEKYGYWEVRWYHPKGYTMPGWYVTGTQWHKLHEDYPQAWRETPGHP